MLRGEFLAVYPTAVCAAAADAKYVPCTYNDNARSSLYET